MIVAPIPVNGRRPLLKITITRLQKAGVKVICMGHDPEDKELCIKLGAEWIEISNDPLGAKWNAGFMAAKKYNPTGVLFVGSSDWVSDNYIQEAEDKLKEFDMVGKLGCHFIDVDDKIRLVNWTGYGKGPRSYEPIGIGRMLSNRFLDKINWQPFDKRLNSGLDWAMWLRAIISDASIGIFDADEIQFLSISTDKWENKHKFEDHWTGKLKSERITGKEQIAFLQSFPEIYDLQNELCGE
jgi:hypothetical protein